MIRSINAWPTVVLAVILTLAFAAGCSAYTVRHGSFVLPKGQVLDDDLIFLGGDLLIEGRVTGDVFAIATGIGIRGRVDGDTTATAEQVAIMGECVGDVRTACSRILVSGAIGRGLSAFTGELRLAPTSRVGGGIDAYSQGLWAEGFVGRGLRGMYDNALLGGLVIGDVRVDSRDLNVLPVARVDGRLEHKGPQKPRVHPDALIRGGVGWTRKDRLQDSRLWRTFMGLGRVLRVSLQLVLGWVLILLLPGPFKRATTVDSNDIGRKALAGGAFLILTPFIAVGLMATLIGLPAGVFVLVAYVMVLVVSVCAAALLAGRLLTEALGWGLHDLLSFTLGSLLIALVGSIQTIALPVYLIAVCAGSGLLVTSVRRKA